MITAVIVNRKTFEMTRWCLRSLLASYPSIQVVLVDNASHDRSTRYIELASALCSNVSCVITEHTSHGSGLHEGFIHCETPYVLTLDSDVSVLQGGWLEQMLERFDDDVFAVGSIDHTDESGVHPGDLRVVHPFCAVWSREKYVALGVPFEDAGQPAKSVCVAAVEAGYKLVEFSAIDPHRSNSYVFHVWGGTRKHLRYLEDQ